MKSANSHVRTGVRDYALLVVIACYATYLHYSFGYGDHSVYLPFLNWQLDPTLYPNDLLLQTQAAHPTYFWWLLSFPASLASNIPFFLFVVHVLVSVSTAWAVFRLALLLTGRRLAAYLAVLSITFAMGRVYGGTSIGISGHNLTLTTFILPFLIFSIELFLRRRYEWAFLVVGIMSNLQPKTSSFLLVMFAVCMILDMHRIGWRKVARCAVVFICGAFPMTVLAIRGVYDLAGPGQLDFDAYVQAVWQRSSQHKFPSLWSARIWIEGVAILLVGAGAFLWCRRENAIPRKYLKGLMALSLGVAVACVLGVIFEEVLPISQTMIMFSFWRSTKFLYVFAAIVAAQYFAINFERLRWGRIPLWAGMCAFLFWGCVPKDRLIPYWILIFWPMLSRRSYKVIWLMLAISGMFVQRQPYDSFMLVFYVGAILLALITVLEQRLPSFKVRWGVAAVLVLTSVLLLVEPFPLWGGHPKIFPKGAWDEVQLWCEQNTEKDAVFLVPFHRMGFRSLSKRSSFVDYKDGAPAQQSVEMLLEWRRRMELYGPEREWHTAADREALYKKLTPQDILRVASEANASYIVTEKPTVLPLAKKYENEKYIVY